MTENVENKVTENVTNKETDTHPIERARARDIVRYAKGLLEKGWTRKVYARNSKGDRVDYSSRDACEFCISGAMRRSVEDNRISPYSLTAMILYDAFLEALKEHYAKHVLRAEKQTRKSAHLSVFTFNDHETTTIDDVLGLMDTTLRNI